MPPPTPPLARPLLTGSDAQLKENEHYWTAANDNDHAGNGRYVLLAAPQLTVVY